MSHKCPTFTSLLLCTSVLPPHESLARRKSLSSAVNELPLCSATVVDPTSFSFSSVFLIRIHRLADVSCSCTVVSPTLPLSRRSLTLSLTRSTSSNRVLFLYFLESFLAASLAQVFVIITLLPLAELLWNHLFSALAKLAQVVSQAFLFPPVVPVADW